ncbi:MAG: FKBP-type peptidyl-prolyl cis-trans isomerase [Bacteroidales bacterium]|nr:FKBP-type peptidyl-prolyl cis-trans isomerase [Bacteroidales bacterium]
MQKYTRIILAVAAVAALAFACAKYESEDNLVSQKRIRDAWMRVNLGQEIEADENGLYILDKTVGTGKTIGDTAFILFDYVVRDLDGNYTKYTTEEVARIMGTYTNQKYYCPEVVQMGQYKLYTPMENFVKSLNGGGKARFLLPPEATTFAYTKELKKYYKSYGNDGTKPALSENYIYDVAVVDVIDDIYQYQIDNLEAFANTHYAGVDSLEKGFYFVKLKENTSEKDTIASNASVKVDYIGKLLDGFCFDTNIADSAKVFGLYNLNKSYDPLSVTFQKNGYTLSDDGTRTYSTDVINGFSMAVGRMNYGEEAIAFFWSPLAYGTKSSDSYPAYAPMCFYIKIHPKE